MDKFRFSGLVLAFGLVCMQANADEAANKYFGQGVHAYFAGNATQALELFTKAIDHGTNDPRIYYFRGMAHHETGDMKSGNADFDKGASLEASGNGGGVDSVSRSLERLQGPLRLTLEEHRSAGRMAFAAKTKKNVVARPTYVDSKSAPGKPSKVVDSSNKSENTPDLSEVVDKTAPFNVIKKSSEPAAKTAQPANGKAKTVVKTAEPDARAPKSILIDEKSEVADDADAKSDSGEKPSKVDDADVQGKKEDSSLGDTDLDDPFADKDSGASSKEPAKDDKTPAENKPADGDAKKEETKKKDPFDDPFGGG